MSTISRGTRIGLAVLLAAGAVATAGLLGLAGVRHYVVEPFRVPGSSMNPSYPQESLFWVWKARAPQKGDVVVFDYPIDPRIRFVKRVAAVAGDRVAVVDHRPVVNGAPVEWRAGGPAEWTDDRCERHTAQEVTEGSGSRSWPILAQSGGPLADWREREVPPGHLFVLGDNRNFSEDSRRWGFVPLENVVGVASARQFTLDPCPR